MLRLCLSLLILLLFQSLGFGQQVTGKARSAGRCSPAVTGNNNTFYFQYCGNDPEEERKIIQLLNQIVADKDQNKKLDEILAILKKGRYQDITTYYPQGDTLTTNPSNLKASHNTGAQVEFLEMAADIKNAKFSAALSIATSCLTKFPGWFTPHLVLAYANAGLCQESKAKTEVAKFLEVSDGAAEFDSFRTMANDLLTIMRQPQYADDCQKSGIPAK